MARNEHKKVLQQLSEAYKQVQQEGILDRFKKTKPQPQYKGPEKIEDDDPEVVAYKKYANAAHGSHMYDEPTPDPVDYGLPAAGTPELEDIAKRAGTKDHPMAAGRPEDAEEPDEYHPGYAKVKPKVKPKKMEYTKDGWAKNTKAGKE